MVYSRQRYIHDAGKLAVGWVWCHYPQPSSNTLRGKRARFRGKYCYLGAPMGVPGVPAGRYVAPGLGWGGLRKENASDDNIERVLLILTLLISGSGKRARFRGKYCYLGAPMGVPGVPAGRYVAPGLGWGGLRKKKLDMAVLREYYWSLPS